MKKIIIIGFLIAFTSVHAQWQISSRKLKTDFVLQKEQADFDSLIKSRISRISQFKNFALHEKQIDKALYQAALYYVRTPQLEKTIGNVLSNNFRAPNHLLIRTIITAKTLYPNKFRSQINSIFTQTKNPKIAVYALYYLKDKNFSDSTLARKLSSKFSGNHNLILKLAQKDLLSNYNPLNKGLLTDILKKSFLKNHLVIFTFLRHNRKMPGLTFIRKPDGAFLMLNDSTLFTIPQLGYSVADLPYFLEDGNTPQGLFSFQGFYQSKKKSIGPTPALITRLPFEVSPVKFSFGKLSNDKWSLTSYLKLLPEDLRDDNRFTETFFAGKLGRNKLVVHGSTDNPQYYNKESYYPLTPTTGCLSSVELWDAESGRVVRSDQLKLVNAILQTGRRSGYLLVVEIDNKQTPVTEKEIEKLIHQTSKKYLR